MSPLTWASLAFQVMIVSSASYLLWFWLIRNYRATQLASFTLLTPVFASGAEETTEFADAKGQRLPYAPKNTASLGLGFEHPAGWDARLGLTHVGRQFSDALNTTAYDPLGSSGEIAAYTLVNLSANWQVGAASTVYVAVINLADKAYLVSRVNGAFAGARRHLVLGLRSAF